MLFCGHWVQFLGTIVIEMATSAVRWSILVPELPLERLNELADRLVDPQSDTWLPEPLWLSILAEVEGLAPAEIEQVCDFVRHCIRIDPEVRFELELRADERDLPAGTLIDRYTILERVGTGGMGYVYKVQVQRPDMVARFAALKIGSPLADFVRNLRAERHILSRLRHPNIVEILDSGTTPTGLPYFVMEYVEGALKLTKYCRSRSLRERVELFVKLCAVVHSVHESNILHRDLKPSNILVNSDGEPKLLDFGLAEFIEPVSDGPSFVSSSESLLRGGTRGRMSPQQEAGERATRSDDIFTLGTVLQDLLRVSPVDDSAAAKRCEAVAKQCLENEPIKRFATAVELSVALKAAFDGPQPGLSLIGRFGAKRNLALALASIIFVAGLWITQSRAKKDQENTEATKRLQEIQELARREQVLLDTTLEVLGGPLKEITGATMLPFPEQEERSLKLISDGNQNAKARLARFYISCRIKLQDEQRKIRAAIEQKKLDRFNEAFYWTEDAIAERVSDQLVGKYCTEEKVHTAYRWWAEIADGGNATAATHLAWLWMRGYGGIRRNSAEAIKWARKAADANDRGGLYVLGLLHLEGMGIVKNEEAAYDLFERAAWRGSIEGQLAMGELHFLGRSLKRSKDLVLAYAWTLVATQNQKGLDAKEDDPFRELEKAKSNALRLRVELEGMLPAERRQEASKEAARMVGKIAALSLPR